MKRLLTAVLSALALAACEPPTQVMQTLAFSETARAQIGAGEEAGARKTAALAVEAAQAAKAGTRDLAIGAAAVALTRANDPGAALDLAQGITSARGRARALVLIAVAQAVAGDETAAAATMDRALDAVEGVSNAGDRDVLLALAAWAQALADDAVGTGDSLAEIEDPQGRADALAWVSELQVEDGDIPAALATALRIPNVKGGDGDVMIMIAEALAVDVFGALDSLLLRHEVRPRVRALIRVAAAHAEAGEQAEADRAYDLARQAAGAIETPGERARALKAVTETQAGRGVAPRRLPGSERAGGRADPSTYKAAVSGDPWATAELLRIALEPAADPDDERVDGERAWIVSRLAAALADAGDKAEARATAALALDLARESPKPEDPAMSLLFVAAAQARAGDIEGALATTRQITDAD